MPDTTAQIQGLLDRLNAGDTAARDELLERACAGAHRLRGDFPNSP
jgi:hypothetical protein